MTSREKEDMYSLLNLEPGADRADIEQAYRHLALKYHPDNDLDSKNTEKFKEVTTAYRSIYPGIKLNRKEDCDLTFFEHFENGLLSEKSERGVYSFFCPGPVGGNCDEMYIEDDDESDPGEKQFDIFVEIIQNSRKRGLKVPKGFTSEKLSELREALIDEREAIKRDSKKQGVSKSKTPSQVPVSKPKPKSKKQKAAEQRRREQEMEKIADELAQTQKLEEEKAKRKEQAEHEKQKKLEEERNRQAVEDRKRKEKEERDRITREKREKEEQEARLKEEERQREKEDKKRKAAEAKQKLADQKAKEEEEKKKKESASKVAKQQQQEKTYPPREVPPRFASKQQKQQQSPPAQQKNSTSTASTTSNESKMMSQANPQKKQNGNASWVSSTSWGDDWNRGNPTGSGWTDIESEAHQQGESPAIDNWSNPGRSNWDAPTSNEIIVDSKDKQAWPSIVDQSEQEDNDNASVKSGSVISSSSNSGQELQGAITPHSASGDWGANQDTSAWQNNANSPRGMNSAGWGSNPMPANHQGLNMQTSPNPAGGDNASNPLATGWGANNSSVSGSAIGRPQNSMQGSAQGGSGSAMWGKPQGWTGSNTPTEKEWGAGDATSGWSTAPPDSAVNSGGWGNPSQNPSPNPNASGWGQPNPAPTTTNTGWGGAKSQSGNPPPPAQWGAPSAGPVGGIPSQANSWGNNPQGQWGTKSVQGESGANTNQAKSQQPSTFAQAAGKGLKPPMPSPAEQAKIQKELERKHAITTNEGWGSRGVRQDTPWAAAESPETKRKIEDPTVWNHTANTGTAIWEASKKPTSGVVTTSTEWGAEEVDDPKMWRNPEPGNGPVWTERREPKTSNSSWGEAPSSQSPQPLPNNPNVWGSGVNAPKERNDSTSSWSAAPEKPAMTSGSSWTSAPEKPPPTSSWGPPPEKPAPPGASWGQPPPSEVSQPIWASGPPPQVPKEIKVEGWEEPLPPGSRNSRVDDGTAVWGNPEVKSQPNPQSWNSSSTPSTPLTPLTPSGPPRPNEDMWKSSRPSGWGDSAPQPPTKMDGSSMWDSAASQRGPGSWGDSKPKTSSVGSWPSEMDGPGGRKMSESSGNDNEWGDTDIGEWNPAGSSNSTWSSKGGFNNVDRRRSSTNSAMPSRTPYGANQPQMRSRMIQLLMDRGVSKERATAAIISNNMNFDSAIAELQQSGALRDDVPQSEVGQFMPPPFSAPNTLPSAQFPASRNSIGSSLIPPSINSKQQNLRPGPQSGVGQGTAIRGSGRNQSQLSQQQMARQLQVAIQAGLINPQILNQQLSWPLLVILQGFIQSYTTAQQLAVVSQQIVQQNKSGYPNARIQFDEVQQRLKAEKQKMAHFQQQIAQATSSDPLSSVQKDLNNMSMGDAAPMPTKSRLTNWLQPSDKEEPDFVKAPGKPTLHQSHSTPNLNPEKNEDSTWGLSPLSSRDWSTSSAINSSSGSKETESPLTSSVSDMQELQIPEFVPGQPWQGFSTKNFDEDPTITPGSVLSSRTPSLNTIDSNHLSSLASRVSSSADVKTVPSSMISGRSLAMAPPTISSDLWGAPISSKNNSIPSSRPPPGLGHKSSGWGGNSSSGQGVGFNRSVSWAPGDRSAQHINSVGGGSWDSRSGGLPCWLILKNLTSQIDENTLRALCSQHGPLLSFINIPSSGQAIVQYSTHEQALRAQKSLDMCMLGNNAMLVNFASEDEVTRLITQQARGPPPSHNLWAGGQQPPRSAGPFQKTGHSQWNGSNMNAAGGSMWGVGGGSHSLWGPSNFDDPQGMNLIPGNLLGESM